MPISASPRPAVAWDWSRLWLGLVMVAPAAVTTAIAPGYGLAMAVGVLPAAGVALSPRRRRRWSALAVSVVAAISISVGALLGVNAVAAVVGLFAAGLGAAVLAGRLAVGAAVMVLAVPLAGLGLSFSPADAFAFAGVMVVSGAYASAVSLLWPEREADEDQPARVLPRRVALGYGLRFGAAAAVAAGSAFALGLDHKGWVCGAALLVMRPDHGLLLARSLGRAASVLIGGFAGGLFVLARPSAVVIAITVGLVVAAMAATQASRWYVTPAFTTFVVFVLLLWDDPGDTAWRFWQRNLETALGIGIGLFFGLVVPALTVAVRTRRPRSNPTP